MRGKKKIAEQQPEAEVVKPAEAAAAPAEKKRGGRKPMTEEEKAEAAKKRAEEKAKADNLSPVLILQFQGDELDTARLVEAAKLDFKAAHKRTLVTDLKLYLKPEERAAYYVINGEFDGKVTY